MVTNQLLISSLTWLLKNSDPNTLVYYQLKKELLVQANNRLKLLARFLLPLTGELSAALLLLKIKANVVHAGLSHPLVLWKVLTLSKPANCWVSLNNNLLIAQLVKAIKDATVGLWIRLLLTLNKTVLLSKVTILTRLEMGTAAPQLRK
jgi:hypothetical protein